jgi:hypothetical protein
MKGALTERRIQNWLWRYLDLRGHTHICPNYTPKGWYECDMFSVTRSGYMVEHEIKLTLGDFRRDAAKKRYRDLEAKHEQLTRGHEGGPSRFYYVVPSGMIDLKDVPKWAGILWVEDLPAVNRIAIHESLSAPKIHRTPVATSIKEHVTGVYYWRFWKERRRA